MKKRAQRPDALTYTILIRGCTKYESKAHGLEKGLPIYRSMLQDKATIKPNNIHINAVINLCARAGDIATMLDIAADLPVSGASAPDHIAFTTILNALREDSTSQSHKHHTTVQSERYIRKHLLNARRIWGEIIQRWRRGDLQIDSALVSAMGRLLLLGDDRDRDDVLSLLEQTMGIKRLIARIGTMRRARNEPSQQQHIMEDEATRESRALSNVCSDSQTPPAERQAAWTKQSSLLLQSEEHVIDDFSTDKEFLTPINGEAQGSLQKQEQGTFRSAFAQPKPDSNTLSLILSALEEVHNKSKALAYWQLLTKQHGVQPDAANYHQLLRNLRVARASSQSFELLQSMPAELIESKTFRLAMSACHRDTKNHHTFATAGKMLDLMKSTLDQPNIRVLCAYLEIALASYPPRSDSPASDHEEPEWTGRGRVLVRALERVEPFYVKIATDAKFTPAAGKMSDEANDTIALIRRMVAVIDVSISHRLVPREVMTELNTQKRLLTRFHTKFWQKSRPSGYSTRSQALRNRKPLSYWNPDTIHLHRTREVDAHQKYSDRCSGL